MNKAIFFDRDGIINYSIIIDNKPYPPRNLGEFRFTEGIKELVSVAKREGYFLFVVTNQPDVARGTTSKEWVESCHQMILQHLGLDKIYCCYHDDRDECLCRKPKPGMILQAQKEYALDLQASYMVGDRWRDIEAGKSAGLQTIFVDYAYGPDEKIRSTPTKIIPSLNFNEDLKKYLFP